MMLEPDGRFRLLLAERLGCTAAELATRMSHAEYVVWTAEEKLRQADREAAERQQSGGMKPRRSGRRR